MVVELSVDSFTSPDLLPFPAPAMERAETKSVKKIIKKNDLFHKEVRARIKMRSHGRAETQKTQKTPKNA